MLGVHGVRQRLKLLKVLSRESHLPAELRAQKSAELHWAECSVIAFLRRQAICYVFVRSHSLSDEYVEQVEQTLFAEGAGGIVVKRYEIEVVRLEVGVA